MNIKDLLQDAKTVCLTGHVRPDGDSVGATLGLYMYLKKNFPEIEADVCLEPPTDKMRFIANIDKINSDYPDHEPYDLMICLDAGNLDRIGKAIKYFKQAKHTVNIDHHISNTYFADENYVEGQSSSACEILYGFLDPDKLDLDIAVALYTGIIYDTGVFKYKFTSPQTMVIAGELMKYGIPTDDVIDATGGIFPLIIRLGFVKSDLLPIPIPVPQHVLAPVIKGHHQIVRLLGHIADMAGLSLIAGPVV